jgi:sec-independent protein translocase protein TatC
MSEADERRMPFLEHLAELRTCLRNSVIAILVCTAIAYSFHVELFALLARPMMAIWHEISTESGRRAEIVFLNPVEPFMVFFKLSMLVGVLLASPIIFRELWRFISPGLYPRERRWGLAFVSISVVLFVGGAVFAYLYVLPASYRVLLGYSGSSIGEMKGVLSKYIDVRLSQPFDIRPMITMDEYLGLTAVLLLVFGGVFELPLLLSILAMLGIVSARQLWRFNRYAIIVFAVLGAVLTPGDLVLGQLMMTGALTVLYNLSILLAVVFGRRRRDDAETGSEPVEALAKK